MILFNKDGTKAISNGFQSIYASSKHKVAVLAFKDDEEGLAFIHEQLGYTEDENGEYFTEEDSSLRIGFEDENGIYPLKDIQIVDDQFTNDFLKNGYTIVRIFW